MTTAKIATRTMKVAQIVSPGGDFEVVDREIPEPGPGQVRIQVQACGICHSDALTKEGRYPGIAYPRAPGHEIIGTIDSLSDSVADWRLGQRVGVGWHGGRDGNCPSCRRGDFRNCRNLKVPGITYDGGYQEYMVAPADALAAVPDSLDATEAAPLLCAGLTTFNALRHSGAAPGDLVAVHGIDRRLGTSWDPVRAQVRLSGCGGRARIRQCLNREIARRKHLHRQHSGRGRRTAETGRRPGDPLDLAELEGHVRFARWARPERQTLCARSGVRANRGHAGATHHRKPGGSGLVGGNAGGRRGRFALFRARRRSPHD